VVRVTTPHQSASNGELIALFDALLGDVHPGRTESHDAEPGRKQPGEALMPGQTLDVQAGPIQAGERPNKVEGVAAAEAPAHLGSEAQAR